MRPDELAKEFCRLTNEEMCAFLIECARIGRTWNEGQFDKHSQWDAVGVRLNGLAKGAGGTYSDPSQAARILTTIINGYCRT